MPEREEAMKLDELKRHEVVAYDAVVEDRNHWIRLFNRLDAAVSRHRQAVEAIGESLWITDHDEALHAAHDRILKSAAKGPE